MAGLVADEAIVDGQAKRGFQNNLRAGNAAPVVAVADGERLRVRARIDAALAPFRGLPFEQRARELRELAIEAGAQAALLARAAEDVAAAATALRLAPDQEAAPAEAEPAEADGSAPPKEAMVQDDGLFTGLGAVPGVGAADIFQYADMVAQALPEKPDGDLIPLGAGAGGAASAAVAGGGEGVPAAAAAGGTVEGEDPHAAASADHPKRRRSESDESLVAHAGALALASPQSQARLPKNPPTFNPGPVVAAVTAGGGMAVLVPQAPSPSPVVVNLKFVRHLDLGGQGLVRHYTMDGRDVALKVPRDESNPAAVKAFLAEALTHACFRDDPHPHILPLIGYQTASPGRCIVTPLMSRGTLDARITRRHLSRFEARHVFCSCVRALAHMHAHGVIHRDIKPQNVLLSEDGDVLVADFGSSVRCLNRSGFVRVRPELAAFSPDFVPPEVFPAALGVSVEVWFNTDSWTLATMILRAMSDVPLPGGGLSIAGGMPSLAQFDAPEEAFAPLRAPGSLAELEVGADLEKLIRAMRHVPVSLRQSVVQIMDTAAWARLAASCQCHRGFPCRGRATMLD